MKRALAAAISLSLCAAALSACGGGSGSSSSAAAPEGQQRTAVEKAKGANEKVRAEYRQRQAEEAESPEEQRARHSVTAIYAGLGKEKVDTGSFCGLLSAEAKSQTIQFAKRASGLKKQWDCRSSVAFMVKRSKGLGAYKAGDEVEVVGVNAEGDRATATVRFGHGPITAVPMVKEGGEWKLGGSLTPPAPSGTGQ